MKVSNKDNKTPDPRDQTVDAVYDLLIGISMIARSLATLIKFKKG